MARGFNSLSLCGKAAHPAPSKRAPRKQQCAAAEFSAAALRFSPYLQRKGKQKAAIYRRTGVGGGSSCGTGDQRAARFFVAIVQKYTKMAEMACRRLSFAGKSVIIV